ncbi:MAG: lipoyl(octanoyl) transferase [Alistipes sp.]|jgi:lipoyl(octanoyl) transferase|nr:lipoyl(octanoyl) transferase [Alistipes sp.]
MKPSIEVVDWGVVDYEVALRRQQALFDELVATKGGRAGWLVFCEHPHVYTLGRSGRAENLLVGEARLAGMGATFHRTGRGGDITYHGPGQMVVYPILDLETLGLGLRDYIASLEEAVIETVARWGIPAGRVEGKTGVWVVPKPERGRELAHPSIETGGDDPRGVSFHRVLRSSSGTLRAAKICAIGVRASRGVVMHGLALNVSTDLGWFTHINPCGMAGAGVTSMEAETGEKPAPAEVKRVLAERILKRI